jgi:Transmembrane domain of unknown function (DUF3566)
VTSDPTAAGATPARVRGLRRATRTAAAPTAPPTTPPADVSAPVTTDVEPAPPVEEVAPPETPGFVAIPVTSAPTAVEEVPPPAAPGTMVPPAPGGTPVQRGPRKARLQIRQVDPWSVMKLGFLLSLALGIVFVVAVGILWSLLDSGGVFDSINKVVADVANDQTDFTVQGSLAFRRVMGVTLVLAVVQVILNTALATLAAFLYNLASGLVGGLDVTLVEEH